MDYSDMSHGMYDLEKVLSGFGVRGVDLLKKRYIDFFIRFDLDSEVAALSCARKARSAASSATRLKIRNDDGEVSNLFCLTTYFMTPSLLEMQKIEEYQCALANEYGGTYDGFEFEEG